MSYRNIAVFSFIKYSFVSIAFYIFIIFYSYSFKIFFKGFYIYFFIYFNKCKSFIIIVFYSINTSCYIIFRYKISSLNNPAQVTGQVTGQVTMLLRALGQDALSLKEMMSRLSLSGRDNFLKTYLNPAMKQNLIEQTHPENPRHRNQRYRLTYQGKLLLKSL